MAYMLSRAFVLSQLQALKISEADLDALPIPDRIRALEVVSDAAQAAMQQVLFVDNQALLQKQLDFYRSNGGLTVVNVSTDGLDLTKQMWQIAQIVGLGGVVTITPQGVFSQLPATPTVLPPPA